MKDTKKGNTGSSSALLKLKKDTKSKAISSGSGKQKTPKLKRMTLRIQPKNVTILNEYMKKMNIKVDTKAINYLIEHSMLMINACEEYRIDCLEYRNKFLNLTETLSKFQLSLKSITSIKID